MIAKKVPYKNKPSAILPLVTYHSRWDELKDEDFNFNKSSYSDYLKGYVLLKNKSQSFSKGDGDIDDFREGARNFNEKKYLEENLEAFDEIMEVANKNGTRVIFVKTPIYDYDLYSKNIKYFEKYLKEKNAEFVDFNKFTKEINLSKSDFYDPHHLNVVGAEKFNLFFIDFMEKNKIFEENLASDKSWQENFKKYNINKF